MKDLQYQLETEPLFSRFYKARNSELRKGNEEKSCNTDKKDITEQESINKLNDDLPPCQFTSRDGTIVDLRDITEQDSTNDLNVDRPSAQVIYINENSTSDLNDCPPPAQFTSCFDAIINLRDITEQGSTNDLDEDVFGWEDGSDIDISDLALYDGSGDVTNDGQSKSAIPPISINTQQMRQQQTKLSKPQFGTGAHGTDNKIGMKCL